MSNNKFEPWIVAIERKGISWSSSAALARCGGSESSRSSIHHDLALENDSSNHVNLKVHAVN